MRSMLFLVPSLLGFGLLFGVPRPAIAYAMHPEVQVVGQLLQAPASHIELTEAIVYLFDYTPESGDALPAGVYPVECVFFVNRGRLGVTHARIRFSYLDDVENEVAYDTLEIRGSYASGTEIVTFPDSPGSTSLPSNCQAFTGLDRGINRYDALYQKFWLHRPNQNPAVDGPVTLAASIEQVDYEDGSSWKGH